jgi:hypothetical protein
MTSENCSGVNFGMLLLWVCSSFLMATFWDHPMNSGTLYSVLLKKCVVLNPFSENILILSRFSANWGKLIVKHERLWTNGCLKSSSSILYFYWLLSKSILVVVCFCCLLGFLFLEFFEPNVMKSFLSFGARLSAGFVMTYNLLLSHHLSSYTITCCCTSRYMC